ncbi:MAG TPA: flagellar export protein FliJ [Candidatus Cybelea sp.]
MPPKFEFRLQPLLDRRKIVEEEKQGNFAACRRSVDDCARELARLGDTRRHFLKQLVETALRCPTADILLRHAHLRCVEVAIDDARHRHLEAEANLEGARQELISASRERRLLEKLKEHRRWAFEADQARREERELDESNARCYDRSISKRLATRRAEGAAR